MAEYSCKPVILTHPIEDVYARLSDFSSYQAKLDELPQDIRAQIGNVRFTNDSIIINAAPVGEIAVEAVERITPSQVKLQAKNAPVPMYLIINMKPADSTTTEVVATIDVEIPMMLRPIVGGKMQEAANMFGDMLSKFFASKSDEI